MRRTMAITGVLVVSGVLAGVLTGCDDGAASGPSQAGLGPAPQASMIGESEAVDRVWALPEVRCWAERVARESDGKVRAVTMVEARPDAATPDPAWLIYAGESHPTHFVRWQQFRVDARSGAVAVTDLTTGELISLADWRQEQ